MAREFAAVIFQEGSREKFEKLIFFSFKISEIRSEVQFWNENTILDIKK